MTSGEVKPRGIGEIVAMENRAANRQGDADVCPRPSATPAARRPRSTASSVRVSASRPWNWIAEGKYGEMVATRITGAQRAHRRPVHRIKLVQPDSQMGSDLPRRGDQLRGLSKFLAGPPYWEI